MARKQESFVDFLLKAPWWVSVILGVISYAGLRWVAPGMFVENKILHAVAKGMPNLANMALFLFGGIAVLSAIFGLKRRGLVEQQESLDTLRATPWKDFEYLVAEAYRRQGFTVDYSFNKGADGGVDLVMRKQGRTSLVQCKQWKKSSVGAPVVREMFGIMTAEHADDVIIVTSGNFTREARNFADGKPIRMVDGNAGQKFGNVENIQNAKGREGAESINQADSHRLAASTRIMQFSCKCLRISAKTCITRKMTLRIKPYGHEYLRKFYVFSRTLSGLDS